MTCCFQKELNIHQIFHLLNKRDFSFKRMSNFKKLYLKKKRLIDIAPEHCFEVTLADFEQIIKIHSYN